MGAPANELSSRGRNLPCYKYLCRHVGALFVHLDACQAHALAPRRWAMADARRCNRRARNSRHSTRESTPVGEEGIAPSSPSSPPSPKSSPPSAAAASSSRPMALLLLLLLLTAPVWSRREVSRAGPEALAASSLPRRAAAAIAYAQPQLPVVPGAVHACANHGGGCAPPRVPSHTRGNRTHARWVSVSCALHCWRLMNSGPCI